MSTAFRTCLRLADHVGINPLRNGLWTPLVVAVNGVCTGAGLQFVGDADVVVASTNATFLDTHVSVGQVSALEPVALVPRIGMGRVLKMCLLGENGRISAEEAHRIGLVDELVDPGDLTDRSLQLARQLTEVSPQAARFTKQAIRMSTELPRSEGGAVRLGAVRVTGTILTRSEGPPPLSRADPRTGQTLPQTCRRRTGERDSDDRRFLANI